MRIALAQLNPTIGALEQNLNKVKAYYQKGLEKKADLIVFTELALPGYPPRDLLNYRGFLDKERALITGELMPLTAQSGVPLLLGANHRRDNRLYNAALLLESGNIKSIHLKNLLPYFDVFDETRYYTSSTDGQIEMLGDLPVAITVCEDIWNEMSYFSEPLYDTNPLEKLVAQDPRLLINLSASPYHYGKHALREDMLAFLAQKHNTGIIYLNQVGANDELIFDGSSLVFNNRGELLYRAPADKEEIFIVETANLFKPAVQIVPPDVDDISTIKQILELGTKDYLSKTGFKKVVLGLSGGIDSAVVATLAAEALGPENVLGIIMPSPYSSSHSREDALELVKNLGIKSRIIRIDEPFKTFINLLNNGKGPVMDLAEENLQARLRGLILMQISNREGHLALVTGNKSELAVGYSTLYGDMAGGLAILSDVRKMMVYELAHHINALYGKAVIPERIIEKAPSAELRPGQKDEDSLPPYKDLDPILELYLEKNYSPSEIIAEGHDEETVKRVIKMVDTAEYKRRQAATGLRISPYSFGAGRRAPVARGFEHY